MSELSIILPTFNERENIPVMAERLRSALTGIDYEIIVVDDDSPDGTADITREMGQTDATIRIVHRIGRRGLSSACVEGMMASSAPFVAVMDADGQHDETIVPRMLALIKSSDLDIVIGSRNVAGGNMGEFAKNRVALSQLGRWLSRTVARVDVSDPMSGFFLLRRSYLDEVVRSLSLVGFKILLDLLASSSRPVRFTEVGYRFRNRILGESKLDILVGIEYLQLLADKAVGGVLPVTYILFGLVGSIGLFGSVALVSLLMQGGMAFHDAQLATSLVVIALNFFLNNALTFRSVKLRGWRILTGLAAFYAACAVGLVANLRFAEYLMEYRVPWELASLAGILVASVWNYWVSSIFVWRVNQQWRRKMTAQRIHRAQLAASR